MSEGKKADGDTEGLFVVNEGIRKTTKERHFVVFEGVDCH